MLVPTQDWPNGLHTTLHRLNDAGFESVLVGGSVRDLMLHRPVHDWDVATAATPEQVAAVFARTVPTGERHGTTTVLVDDLAIEVTTFRLEGRYSDGRRPDSVVFTNSLTEDLKRRDFTINAMAARTDGTVFDPLRGLSDLQQHLIRAVGTPGRRFTEDALRIFRGLRLAAELSFDVQRDTLCAMEAHHSSLGRIARERIGAEMARLLAACDKYTLQVLADGPWLDVLAPPWPMARDAMAQMPRMAQPMRQAFQDNTWLSETDRDFWRQVAVFAAVAGPAGWSPETCAKASRAMAWPRRFQAAASAVVKLLADDVSSWSDATWQLHLFRDSPEVVFAACAIEDSCAHDTESLRQQRFTAAFRDRPIQSQQELQISGRDILQLGVSGPAVGNIKSVLLREVLTRQLENTPITLLERARELATHHDEEGDAK
jgi:tRNA nucleotidyltransferase (CCA-adding enzyme)